MTKHYLVNYTIAADAPKGAEAELAQKLEKNFPNPKKLSSVANTWLIAGKGVTSGEVWLEAYTDGLSLNVMKVSEDRAATLR